MFLPHSQNKHQERLLLKNFIAFYWLLDLKVCAKYNGKCTILYTVYVFISQVKALPAFGDGGGEKHKTVGEVARKRLGGHSAGFMSIRPQHPYKKPGWY